MSQYINTNEKEKSEYVKTLKTYGKAYVRKVFYVFFGILTLQIIGFYFMNGEMDYTANIYAKSSGLFAILFYYEMTKLYPRTIYITPYLFAIGAILVNTQAHIKRMPTVMTLPGSFLTFSALQKYLNQLLMLSVKWKNIQNISIIFLYLLRCYCHFGYLEMDIVFGLAFHAFFQSESAKQHQKQLDKISELYINKSQIAQDNFLMTLNIVPQGILIFDLKSKDIAFSNKECLEMLQISDIKQVNESLSNFYMTRKQFLTTARKSNLKLFQSIESLACDRSLLECLANIEAHILNLKGDMVFKNKQLKKYYQVKVQIMDNNSQIIVILNDISRIKRIESQTQKMKSMFFASVAHELKTPLNSIIPLTKRLQQLIKDPHMLKLLSVIKNSSAFLENIIEDALDINRLENNQFKLFEDYFNVSDAVNEVKDIMEFQLQQKNIPLEVSISSETPQCIYSDEKRFKQILFNLIANAIKFTYSGSIKIKIDFNGSILSTKVIDSGIGIKAENIDKLFKFFGQIEGHKKINRGGMGLGLTICKMIVQQMNGKIFVTSEYRKGSIFEFQIAIDYYRNGSQIFKNKNILEEMKLSFNSQELYQEKVFQIEESTLTNDLCTLMESEQDIFSDRVQMLNMQDQEKSNFQVFTAKQFSYSYLLNHSNPNNIMMSNTQTTLNQKQIKVLIVDDSPYNLFVLQELLDQIEEVNTIQTGQNGQDAIDKMLLPDNLTVDNCSNFDYLLIDLHMPVLDGFNAVKELDRMHRLNLINLEKTKIIAVSAITKEQFTKSLHSDLFHDFIEKPVNFNQLAQLIRN